MWTDPTPATQVCRASRVLRDDRGLYDEAPVGFLRKKREIEYPFDTDGLPRRSA